MRQLVPVAFQCPMDDRNLQPVELMVLEDGRFSGKFRRLLYMGTGSISRDQ